METINSLYGLAPQWASGGLQGAWPGGRGWRRRWGLSPQGEPSGHPADPAPKTEMEEQEASWLGWSDQNGHFHIPGHLRGLRGLPLCFQCLGGRVGPELPTCHEPREGSGGPTQDLMQAHELTIGVDGGSRTASGLEVCGLSSGRRPS